MRHSIKIIHFPRVKASEGMKNIITKDLNISHEVVSVEETEEQAQNHRMLSCQQILTEELSLRDIRDVRGAIWVK